MIAAAAAALPESPYKGLVPYGEEDAPFFFGREDDQEIIAANLQAYRLTLVYGPSGVGKSSVLRAGVAHHLRSTDASDAAGLPPEYIVVVFASWRDDPLAGLLERVRLSMAARVPSAAHAESSPSLTETLARWTASYAVDLLVILDQFEEYFLYHADDAFEQDLARAITSRELRVNFLVSIRDDALARLDRFKGRIPSLFDNYLRIDHLDRAAATSAIERPLERFNDWLAAGVPAADGVARPAARTTIEPALREAVLDELGAGQTALGGAGGAGMGRRGDAAARIETPYLQLVMERLWREERQAGSDVLRLTTLTRLGGAGRIVRTHLDAVMGRLTPAQRHAAARAFTYLVTPSGSKVAHSLADLAGYSGIPEAELGPLAETLAGGDIRILRPVAPPAPSAPVRYEIFHDVLAAAVADWRRRVEMERRAQVDTLLRPLQGWAWSVATRLAAAAALIVVPILLAVRQDPDVVTRAAFSWNLPGATLAGLALLLVVAGAAIRRMGRIVAATRAGFPWSALADVVADRGGDIGDLVAGAGRYDMLPGTLRAAMRAGRRAQGALAVLIAPVAIGAVAAAIALGTRRAIGPDDALGLVVWPVLTLLAGIVVLRLVDAQYIWRARRLRQGSPAPAARARALDSFEGLSAAAVDEKAVRRARAGAWACRAALALLPIVAVLAAVPFLVAEVVGGIVAEIAVPNRARFEDRIRIRQAGDRLAPDPAITPLVAGAAYYALAQTGAVPATPGGGASTPMPAYERPLPRVIAAPFAPAEGQNPFGSDLAAAFDTIISRAASGLRAEELRVLERMAAFDGLAEASIVARAARIDYLGARLVDGHPVTTTYYPVPSGLRHVRQPYLARAAVELSNGRRADAEQTLREMISFATVTMDEAHSAFEAVVGAAILDAGLMALAQLYEGTGDAARAEEIRRRRDAATREAAEPAVPVSAAAAVAAEVQGSMVIAADTTRQRSERWEAMALVTVRPCTNTREMVFGPTGILTGTLRIARENLARFASDREWLDNMDVSSGRIARSGVGRRLYGNLFARCSAIGQML